MNSRPKRRGVPSKKAMAARRKVLKVSMNQKLKGFKTKIPPQSTKASPMLAHNPFWVVDFDSRGFTLLDVCFFSRVSAEKCQMPKPKVQIKSKAQMPKPVGFDL